MPSKVRYDDPEIAEHVGEVFSSLFGPLKPGAAMNLVRLLGEDGDDRVEQLRQDIKLARKTAKRAAGLGPGDAGRIPGKSICQVRQRLEVRLVVGNAYLAHKAAAEAAGEKNFVSSFCGKYVDGAWSCTVKQRIIRYGKLAASTRWGGKAGRGGLRMKAASATPMQCRRNAVGTQGRPIKAIPVREQLFEWFVMIRSSLLGRMPYKIMMTRAKMLLLDYVEACMAQGIVPDVFKPTPKWMRGFKREYGLSFRKPNKRYKLSRRGVCIRLEPFWLNNIAVRHYAMLLFGVDPGQHCDGADQKPWHVNEAGSKLLGTLAMKGAKSVPLREDHNATRARMTIMTYVSNNAGRLARGMPLECLFCLKGSGSSVMPQLVFPAHGRFSAQCSESGSYSEHHVFLFLEFHLEEASPARRAANDWRLFYLDIYSAHQSRRIWDICWDRMYILLFHGGGCTGLTQSNDLWLHGDMERLLLEVEQLDWAAGGLLRPDSLYTPDRQVGTVQYSTGSPPPMRSFTLQ
jgi:hypothetical protein